MNLVECVPNFSEGRSAENVAAIAGAISEVPGVRVLDVSLDPDHNRSVITFAGHTDAVADAAVRAAARAAALIDLRSHSGVHPRTGALDVLPFVPLGETTMEECAALSVAAGERIWRELGIPVFLYEAAARIPGRRVLPALRRSLRGDPAQKPDIGGALHPSAGCVIAGARKPLVAFNVNLAAASDDRAARAIALRLRESSGGLPCVRALGLWLRSRNLGQVSMNLTDVDRTSIETAFLAVERECAAVGVAIVESELIGLAPRRALNSAIATRIRLRGFSDRMILESRLEQAG